jgi:hypothetical protein
MTSSNQASLTVTLTVLLIILLIILVFLVVIYACRKRCPVASDGWSGYITVLKGVKSKFKTRENPEPNESKLLNYNRRGNGLEHDFEDGIEEKPEFETKISMSIPVSEHCLQVLHMEKDFKEKENLLGQGQEKISGSYGEPNVGYINSPQSETEPKRSAMFYSRSTNTVTKDINHTSGEQKIHQETEGDKNSIQVIGDYKKSNKETDNEKLSIQESGLNDKEVQTKEHVPIQKGQIVTDGKPKMSKKTNEKRKEETIIKQPQKEKTIIKQPQKEETIIKQPQKEETKIKQPQKEETKIKQPQREDTIIKQPEHLTQPIQANEHVFDFNHILETAPKLVDSSPPTERNPHNNYIGIPLQSVHDIEKGLAIKVRDGNENALETVKSILEPVDTSKKKEGKLLSTALHTTSSHVESHFKTILLFMFVKEEFECIWCIGLNSP